MVVIYLAVVDDNNFVKSIDRQEADHLRFLNLPSNSQVIPECVYNVLNENLGKGHLYRLLNGDLVEVESITSAKSTYKLKIEYRLNKLKTEGCSVSIQRAAVIFPLDDTTLLHVSMYANEEGLFHIKDKSGASHYLTGEEYSAIKTCMAVKLSKLSELAFRFILAVQNCKTVLDIRRTYGTFLHTLEE